MFTAANLQQLTDIVVAAWTSGADRDWTQPAGTLEWSCLFAADHTVDSVFSYALFLASGREGSYPPFGELHALPEAGPHDLIEGLRTVSHMLWAVIVTADPDERAVIRLLPTPLSGSPLDFAARGGLELILHAADVCAGLGVAFEPPRDLCDRMWDATQDWSTAAPIERTGDSWHDLLVRSGRPVDPTATG